jgi:hypothetical protein
MLQVIKCSHCSKTYEPYKTSKGNDSKICPSCREKQQKAEARRPPRSRNYQAEAKRNLENSWKSFLSKTIEKREKECTLTKEQYFELIQKNCTYCNYYNEDEINGIDRLDNNKGYILDNCVSCCKHCNRMKHIFHPVFFIEKAKLITQYLTSQIENKEFYNKWKIYIHKIPTSYTYVKRVTEERRNIEYSLTKEEYDQIIYKPCYLCGFKNKVGNGLDRQDNSKGYSIDNVLPCCSSCNMMKAFYTKDDFIKQMKKIHEFKKDYPIEWNSIPYNRFQMGAAKTENIKEEKEKQWRAVSIYKAVKSDCLEEFKNKTLETTKWSESDFENKTKELFEKIKQNKFELVESDLKKLVENIRYNRLKNK